MDSPPGHPFTVTASLDGVDWTALKSDLGADHFDNGRSLDALRQSFEQSQHVALAWAAGRVIGTARLLSDGVCNAYLVDVWTASPHRRRGVARAMIVELMACVPGQHIGLQVDTDTGRSLYQSLGFAPQPEFWSAVVGQWLAGS